MAKVKRAWACDNCGRIHAVDSRDFFRLQGTFAIGEESIVLGVKPGTVVVDKTGDPITSTTTTVSPASTQSLPAETVSEPNDYIFCRVAPCNSIVMNAITPDIDPHKPHSRGGGIFGMDNIFPNKKAHQEFTF